MSSTMTDTRLHAPCRGHMPPGSSRVKRLLTGRIPFSSQLEWPDGRPAKEIVTMHSLGLQIETGDEEDADLILPRAGSDSPSDGVEPLFETLPSYFVRPSYVLTSDERFSIACALETALEVFQTGSEAA